jgi:serine/threonine protein kinase
MKVYLVDFGFAHVGGGEVAVSSVVKGTLGFMPPEQLFNRQLTEASDLYSLGTTLICLLTQTKSTQIGNLIDSAYRINVKQLLPALSPKFIDWLQKMIEPNLKNRFDNAAAALKALEPIDVVGNAAKQGMLARATKLSPGATAVGLATLGFVALLGTTNIISRISNSRNHHEHHHHHWIREYDKDQHDRYDKDDDDKHDRYDKDDDDRHDRYDKDDDKHDKDDND